MYGAWHALGLQSYLRDLGIEVDVVLESDSNAAKAFAGRQGLGKQRHVQTRYLWIQHQVATGAIKINKIKTDHNVSDILTRVLSGTTIQKHMATMGYNDELNLSKLHKHIQIGL